METKSYKQLVSELDAINNLKLKYDTLINCGIPVCKVHHWEFPTSVTSGYSMGETIVIFCNDKRILTIDRCQHYAKSCKWKPKHGHIKIVFTKKDLRKYVDMYEHIHYLQDNLKYQPRDKQENVLNILHESLKSAETFLLERIDKKYSTIK